MRSESTVSFAGHSSRTNRLKILLVEDNLLDARRIQTMLDEALRQSHELVTAGTVAEAVKKLGEGPYDLVLLDILLPDGTGEDLLQRMPDMGRSAPIVAMSCLDKDSDLSKSVLKLARDFVEKDKMTTDLFTRVVRHVLERELVEEKLSQQEQQHRALAANVPGAVYRCQPGPEWSLQFASDQVEGICGYTSSELTGDGEQTWVDLILAEDRPAAEQAFAKALGSQEPFDIEYRVRHKAGHEVWVQDRGQGVFSSSGELKWISGIAFDITEKKKLQMSVRESEGLFRAIIENSIDLVTVHDLEGRIRFVSPSVRKTLGYEPADLIGANAFDLVHPEDLSKARETFVLLLRDKTERKPKEYRMRRANGTWCYLETVGINRLREPGINGIILTTRDITRRRQLEEGLQRERTLLRTIIDSIPNEVMFKDTESRYVLANKASMEALGARSHEELIGKSDADFVRPDLAKQHREDERRILETGVPEVNQECVRLNRETGKVEKAHVQTKTVVRDQKGEIAGLLTVNHLVTERKLAEVALQESESRYRTLIDTSNDVFYTLSPEGKFLSLNPAFETITGWSREEWLGKSFLPLVHDEDVPLALHNFKGTLHGDRVYAYAVRIRKKNGEFVVGELHPSPLRKDGRIVGASGVARDITERVRAEETLRRLGSILEATPDFVGTTSPDGRPVFINQAGRRMVGLAQDADLSNMTIAQFHPAWAAEKIVREGIPSAIQNGFWAGETAFRSPDGHEIPALQLIVVHKGRNGAVEYLSIVARDITERKRMEKEQARLTEDLRLLLESTDQGIYGIDLDGRCTFINAAGARKLGYHVEEMTGKSMHDLIHHTRTDGTAYPEKECPILNEAIRGEAGVRCNTEVLWKKDGTSFFAEYSAFPIVHQGANRGAVITFTDITQQKALEDQLRQAQKLESLGTLAGGIAHDFNNILGIILGHSSILEKVVQDPTRLRNSIDAIGRAAHRGAGLVKQLLTFARKSDVVVGSILVQEQVDEIEKLLHETFPRSIEVITVAPKTLPPITADGHQIHQVLINLCVNARDAMMPEGGKLTIKAGLTIGDAIQTRFPLAPSGEYVCIAVSDTGKGMDEATRSRIYEPFFTTKEIGKGTGLGLATVYGIVQTYGGFIDVESQVGKGTTFVVCFPAEGGGKAQELSSAEMVKEVVGGSETILMVEDEELLRSLIMVYLQGKGYTVLEAKDGLEGVEVYAQNHASIALVLSDLGLPRLGGEQMFALMKKINPDVKVVFASGYQEPGQMAGLLKSGAKDFVQKPYVPTEVLRRVREVLDRK